MLIGVIVAATTIGIANFAIVRLLRKLFEKRAHEPPLWCDVCASFWGSLAVGGAAFTVDSLWINILPLAGWRDGLLWFAAAWTGAGVSLVLLEWTATLAPPPPPDLPSG